MLFPGGIACGHGVIGIEIASLPASRPNFRTCPTSCQVAEALNGFGSASRNPRDDMFVGAAFASLAKF